MSLLAALQCQNTERPPIWLMRQAGRYLPEFRELRKKHPILQICHKPELATEVTLMPFKRFPFDAAILFSDILTIPQAMGFTVHFRENFGPIIEHPITTTKQIGTLPHINLDEKLSFLPPAISAIKRELSVPLLGFAGAPFTLASYLIEGKTNRDLKLTKQWLMQEPKAFHTLLNTITDHVIAALKIQIAAGVDAVQLFDSWAGQLTPHHFTTFCTPYLQKILDAIHPRPTILFCRGSSYYTTHLAALNPTAISLDWHADLATIRQKHPTPLALQGNLDPSILFGSPTTIKQEVTRLLTQMQGDPGYIFNLGHGILPDTPLDSVHTLIDTIKSH
ncbi:MAG: uroporphyrinogen decarboxylase [Chlamydiia bacterium]|nr:uroporphyrinogen decarboxylase [Chlamydiia bacterium]